MGCFRIAAIISEQVEKEENGGESRRRRLRRVLTGMKALNLLSLESKRGKEEESKSKLLTVGMAESPPRATTAEFQTARSSFRYCFVDVHPETDTDQVVIMVSEDETPTAPPSAQDHRILIRWRRIESLERSITPVARSLIRFSYHEISAITVDFHPGRLLGRGALSRVYRGRVKLGGGRRRASSVAVKRLHGEENECAKSFYRELMIAGELCHPNVAPLLGFCVDPQGLFLVYKFFPRGNLDLHLHPEEEEGGKRGNLWRRRRRGSRGAGALPWAARWKVTVGLARAVEYLHQGTDRCVIHRDIKPSNILLSSSKNPKLCDFGLATWTQRPSLPFLCKTVKGTFGYLAPEYFQHGKISEKTDIYAYGVVLLELLTGRRPIDANPTTGEENLLQWAKPLLLQGGSAIEELIDSRLKPGSINRVQVQRLALAAAACLNNEESARPTISQVIGMLLHGEDDVDLSSFLDSESKSDLSQHMSLAMLGVPGDEEDDKKF